MSNIVPVIISGGVGSRLWPLSRDHHPKPFIALPDGDTLIRRVYARARALAGVGHIVTVTNRELLFLTTDEYAEAERNRRGGPAQTFLLEPFGRDTAAAIALAALQVAAKEGRDAILLVLPADHLVQDEAAFAAAVKQAADLAATGRIVTFGIKPDRVETGFGYIEAKGQDVLRFVEKPDAKTAADYVASGRFFWNSGMFCFPAGHMLDTMQQLCPEVLAGARAAWEASQRTGDGVRAILEIDAALFAKVPAISIDYAVMEKAQHIGFVPCDCGWSDIGSWSAMADLSVADAEGNRVGGDVRLHDARDCFVRGEDRLVALVGVANLLVVDTPDALLIADRNRAQDVKAVYNELKAGSHEAVILHRTVHRPWGTYTVLEQGEGFKIKRIVVKPGARLSLQSHRHRSEHWVVVSGEAKVVNGETEIFLAVNQSTYIACGHKHRLENPGQAPLVMIEVQSGDYLGEDDIVRYDDVYGRS